MKYITTCSHFENSEIHNRFEYLGGEGGDDLKVRALRRGNISKTYNSVQVEGGPKVNEYSADILIEWPCTGKKHEERVETSETYCFQLCAYALVSNTSINISKPVLAN